MNPQKPYAINMEARFAPLELIDLQALVDAATDPWYNQTLCRVNDSLVRLGVVQGEFHWHKHEEEMSSSMLWMGTSSLTWKTALLSLIPGRASRFRRT